MLVGDGRLDRDAAFVVRGTAGGPVLMYPWRDGVVLNQARITETDRSGLLRFQHLPVAEVEAAVGVVLEAHGAVADAGYVAVDLYDGSFLYDFETRTMRLIDLGEYRPGPSLSRLIACRVRVGTWPRRNGSAIRSSTSGQVGALLDTWRRANGQRRG